MPRTIKNVIVALAVFVLGLGASYSQTTLMTGLKLVDRGSSKTHEWTVNSGATGNQGFLFPAAIGTAGQIVKIASVSSNNATFEWTTPAASSAGTSARLTSDATESSAWDTGPSISVSANKNYRIVGEFAIYRGATGGNDKFLLRINTPSSGSSMAYSVECLDCPSGTTGVPQYKSASGTSVQLDDAIDPGGNSGANSDQEGVIFHYRIEGLAKIAANGTVRLTFNKSIGSEDTVMMANSYWALIEIN